MSADDPSENKVIHEVDGIQEYDNKLPNWWLYLLYGSVVFAFGYWFVYHTAGIGELPKAAYDSEMDRAAAAAPKKTGGVMTPEALVALSKDRGTLAQGKAIFASTCAACHRADGGGMVGPNLTDEYWLHGGAPEKVLKTVTDGVPDKGMLAWGAQLGPDRVQAVTAYVISLRNTNVPGGKAPQGERETLSLQ
jgi:cytochrome c oxidase cbb3-type subunit III